MLITNIAKRYHLGSTLIVGPNDDLAIKYDWLKSSDRDDTMGALSATNRRTLILSPGTYTLTDQWMLDTNYVDVVSLSGNPKDTIVTRNLRTIAQTADNVRLIGFTLECTADSGNNEDAFRLNPTNNNDNSYYGFMHFKHSNPNIQVNQNRRPLYSLKDISGTWEFCECESNYGWYVKDDQDISGTFYFCKGADYSFKGGDNGGDISGTFYTCKGGIGCWEADSITGTFYYCDGGTSAFRISSGSAGTFNPTMYFCVAGDTSFVGDTSPSGGVKGTLILCIAGDSSFGGCTGDYGSPIHSDAYYQDCQAGEKSFGYGKDCAGTFIRCRGGDKCFGGYYGSGTYYGTFSGYAEDCVASGMSFGMGHASCTLSGTLVRCRNGTVAEYKAGISGADTTTFSGVCKDSHPWGITNCTAHTTIYPFDNGQTYTNEGSSADVNFSLPPAKAGLEYTFCQTDYANNRDIRIYRDGTDKIYDLNEADCNDWYGNDHTSEKYFEATLKCRKDGEWRVVRRVGTPEHDPGS